MTNNVAKTVIDICGGVAVVATWCHVTKKCVYDWMKPKEKGGTGGLIPSKYHRIILNAAKANHLPLEYKHFF